MQHAVVGFRALINHMAFSRYYLSSSIFFATRSSLTMISWLPLLLLFPFVFSLPLERRAASHMACGKFETIPSGKSYSLLTNLWGESTASSGSQCSTLHSVLDGTVKWSTEWTWSGEDTIKSFSNIQLNRGINQQLSAITSMPVRSACVLPGCIVSLRLIDVVVDLEMVPEQLQERRGERCL